MIGERLLREEEKEERGREGTQGGGKPIRLSEGPEHHHSGVRAKILRSAKPQSLHKLVRHDAWCYAGDLFEKGRCGFVRWSGRKIEKERTRASEMRENEWFPTILWNT